MRFKSSSTQSVTKTLSALRSSGSHEGAKTRRGRWEREWWIVNGEWVGKRASATIYYPLSTIHNPPLSGLIFAVWLLVAAASVSFAAPVTLEFSGLHRFREGELRVSLADQIEEIEQSGLTDASADDAAFFLGLFYRRNGYSQADVTWVIAGRDRLRLAVSEGPSTTLGAVKFLGNNHISDSTLRDYLLGPTHERFPAGKRELPFVEADIRTGVERIAGFYRSEGFLDSVVESPVIVYSAGDTRASVTVTIKEGMRYWFGKLRFEGDLVFYPQTELLKTLEPFSKKPYTRQQVTNMERAVVYFYRTRGYFDVKAEVHSDPAEAQDGVVPVVFTVQSGDVYRFDGVKVTGLDRLNPTFLPKRFGSLKGKFYNPEKIDTIFQDMMHTGLFKSLHITSKPLPTHEIELDMEVEEAKAKEVGFSLGYGTFEGGFVGLHLGDRDVFGTGRPLMASVEVSQRFLKGEISYSDPWFFDSAYSFREKLYALSEDWDGYSKFVTGLRTELSRKLSKHFEATAFVLTRDVQITNNGIDPEELGPTNYLVNSLGAAFTLDFRDTRERSVNPGRGMVMNATFDYAADVLGSTLDFVRGTYRFSYYLPIKKTLLAFGVRAGALCPLAGHEQIPIDERFFNGGSLSVRSFAERRLGPTDSHGFPIGGETFTTLNAEYVFPIYGDLDGAVFLDAGSVGQDVADGPGMMRYGIGAGLRYRLPIGPLRLDYGLNPSPRANEAPGALHLSFGFAF